MHARLNLYTEFIRVLHFQLKEVPEDMFVDIVEGNNFLYASLREFFSNVQHSTELMGTFKRRVDRFKVNLTSKFRWDFDIEPDDEAPVVVEVDDVMIN